MDKINKSNRPEKERDRIRLFGKKQFPTIAPFRPLLSLFSIELLLYLNFDETEKFIYKTYCAVNNVNINEVRVGKSFPTFYHKCSRCPPLRSIYLFRFPLSLVAHFVFLATFQNS